MKVRNKANFSVIGQKFGMLTAISEGEKIILPSGQPNRTIICRCDCGVEKPVRLLHLCRNRITSCGCVTKTLNGESKTPICRAWKSMRERCSPKYFQKHLYFDKGITVCEEWDKNYFSFKEWAVKNGLKKGLQIDRIDNSRGYSPNNCRVTTNIVNANNRDNTMRVIYNNEERPIMDVFRELSIPEIHQPAIRRRLGRGWDVSKAFNTPIKTGHYVTRKVQEISE